MGVSSMRLFSLVSNTGQGTAGVTVGGGGGGRLGSTRHSSASRSARVCDVQATANVRTNEPWALRTVRVKGEGGEEAMHAADGV
jgi:hypothetical protein